MIKQNKIELASRRNILDGFLVTRIPWYGNLEQTGFLGRLFDLSSLPSTDGRYKTAAEDIYKHTYLNFDWPDEWVFTDSRFNLLHISDQQFLDFLCLTIHPTVRDSEDQVVTLLEIYNNNLAKYKIEIVAISEIAGKPIYGIKDILNEIPVRVEGEKQSRLALIIGCSNYSHGGFLANPINDANLMESKLISLDFEVVKVLDPTLRNIKISMDDFGERLKGFDIGLFYFAGHGVQVKGLNYLVPVDAEIRSENMVEYDCVEAARVLACMEGSNSKVNIVILDACRDNPFERSWGRGLGQRGLTTMNAPKGSLIAYSTSPGKTASDGDGDNGLYTQSLLKHIATKDTTVMSMFQRVRMDVIAKSNNEQVPWESTSLTDDFYFNS